MDYIILPFDIGRKNIEEGFYLQHPDNSLFYLWRRDEEWYLQFPSDEKPTLIEKTSGPIEGTKVDPHEVLKRLEKEREFIESRLEFSVMEAS